MSIPTQDQEKTAEPQLSMSSFRPILRNRNFVLLWIAQLISQIVLNAANYGVIVLVNEITHNNVFMAGLAIIVFTLPAVPFSAIAGVLVDRQNKRQVLWISNLLRVITMFLVVASLLVDNTNLWPLFALSFLTSVIGQFFSPAEGASIPLLVGERELMPALSLFNISLTLSQAIGFLLLGRVIATIFPPFTLFLGSLALHVESIDMLFVVAGVLYAVCAVLILLIPGNAFKEEHLYQRHRTAGTHVEIGQALESLWRDLVSGWHIIRSDRLLYFSVIQVSVASIIMLMIGELAGAFVQSFLNRPPEDMSLVLAPAAIGLVGASVLMPRLAQRLGKLRLTTIGLVALGAGFILLPVSHWIILTLDPKRGTESPLFLWLIVFLVFALGVAMSSINIPAQTILQERAPEASRARVLSLQFMLYNAGSIPVLLFAGVIAEVINLSALMILMAVAILLFCWWGIHYVGQDEERHGDITLRPSH